MSFQERKKRERELKKEMDQQDRRIALAKRGATPEEVRVQPSEIKPEVIVKPEAVTNTPPTVVEIGERKPIDPPFMYTRKGTLNTPHSD